LVGEIHAPFDRREKKTLGAVAKFCAPFDRREKKMHEKKMHARSASSVL